MRWAGARGWNSWGFDDRVMEWRLGRLVDAGSCILGS